MTISIVVPSLNQGVYIQQCLDSILCQQFTDLEVIIIDGGSTDATIEVLQRYSSEIGHLVIEEDDGQADALRKGFALAEGDIQCYLNSDDYLLAGTLAFVHDYFTKHPNIDAIYSDRVFVDTNNNIIGCWRLPRHSRYLMERWDYIPQETCFWRRALYDRTAGIDRNLQFAMDYDLFVQFMRVGTIEHVPEFLAAFRDHDQSKTHNLNETIGKTEVQSIKDKYGIRSRAFDRISGGLLRRLIEFRSRRFLAANAHVLQAACARRDAT